MSLLDLQFRSVASRLQLLNYQHPDLAFETVSSLVASQLKTQWQAVIKQGKDPEDPATVWELLYIDAVIVLENNQGDEIRVAVALTSDEHNAYRIHRQAQQPMLNSIRQTLNIGCHWVICVERKKFPTDGEWVDILYREIDQPIPSTGCRLIVL